MTLERKADDLARYLSELSRQLQATGMTDVHELFGLAGRLRAALDILSPKEIAWAREHIEELLDGLRTIEERLRLVGRLKVALEEPGNGRVPAEWQRPTG